MSLPDPDEHRSVQTPDALSEYEAISLFTRRARAANNTFALNESNAEQVIAICRRLDGLPLAIELAANRARVLSAGQILERLSGSLDLLAGGASNLPARQQSLRGAIGWGYDVLTPAQQALFRLMAVYVGGCTLEALQGRAPETTGNEMQLVDNLSALIDSSLVRRQETANGARFSMLDTIAEYAMEQLAKADEVDQARRHHAAFYLHLAEEAEPHLQGGDQKAWLERLDTEHDNIRDAYDYFRSAGDGVLLARLVSSLRRFWYLRGNISEGEEWLQAALTHAEILPPDVLARTLHGIGTLLWSMGEMARAEGYFAKSLVLRRELGDKRGIADMLNNLGIVLLPQGKYNEARTQHTESLEIYRELGDGWSISLSLANLGLVALDAGEYAEAEALLSGSLTIRRDVGDEQGAAQSLNNLGIVRRCTGDIDGARALHEESLNIFRKLGDKWSIAFAMNNMAYALLESESEEASHYFLDSLALFKELGVRTGIVSSFEGLAQLGSSGSKVELAATLFGLAERLRGEIDLDMLPYNRASYAERRENSLHELGEDKFQVAWAAGQQL
ncbi:MAG: tetratricopeptide repeat protein, partial [Chloroflexia bacterium]